MVRWESIDMSRFISKGRKRPDSWNRRSRRIFRRRKVVGVAGGGY